MVTTVAKCAAQVGFGDGVQLIKCELESITRHAYVCMMVVKKIFLLLGTKMLSPPVCEDAQCEPCPENEYQDAYTRDDICQRQPYCDPSMS